MNASPNWQVILRANMIFPRFKPVRLTALIAVLLLGACAEAPQQPVEPEDASSPLRTRLLTGEQYANTIAQVFGQDIADSIIPPIPPMTRTDGLLASGAAFVGVTSDQLSQIQLAAESVAEKVVDEAHRDYLVPCAPASITEADPDCARQFLATSGRLLQRRPLAEPQLSALVDIATRAADTTEDFYSGLAIALESILISPGFIFIAERAEPDPAHPGKTRLDAWSLASRLSFFLWNGPPDDALLSAAASGDLQTPSGLQQQVERMLESTRLEVGMRAFFDDMMAFDEFDSLSKDAQVYPSVTGNTLADAREQTLRTVIDHLLDQQADYRDLFTTKKTFMSMPLAVVYDTSAEAGWSPYEFDEDSPRQGLLTHMSFLASHSHAVRSSPTLRGKALRELFLCQKVPDPPPNVDFSLLEEAEHAATARERLNVHNTNPSCAGCHLVTDPMGLSLEKFDGAGRFRETENGAEIDIAGELDGVFYEDVAGLASAMRNHPKLSYCLMNRVFAYGTGGPVSLKHDRDTLKWLESRFIAEGHRLPALLMEVTTSRAFRHIRAPEPAHGVADHEDTFDQSSMTIAGME